MKSIYIMALYAVGCVIVLAACQDPKPTYSITEAYQYPVVPRTEEWKNLSSLQEMAEACQIPDEILSEMTTEALVETIVNYPLLINIGSFENGKIGAKHVRSYFNGLDELYDRDDAIEKVEAYIDKNYQNTDDVNIRCMRKLVEIVLDDLRRVEEEKLLSE